MKFSASHKFVQMSARKIRPIADLVRGKLVDEAKNLLKCYPNRGARLIEDVLASALANADDRRCKNLGQLEVSSILIDSGPIGKRFRPKARGATSPIKKRMAHITVTLE